MPPDVRKAFGSPSDGFSLFFAARLSLAADN
jgi:hypothetical protein